MTTGDEQVNGVPTPEFPGEEQPARQAPEALAIKRLLARELAQFMRRRRLSKVALAALLGTSRTQVDRLLDPENASVTLDSMARIAGVVGKRMAFRLVRPKAGSRRRAP